MSKKMKINSSNKKINKNKKDSKMIKIKINNYNRNKKMRMMTYIKLKRCKIYNKIKYKNSFSRNLTNKVKDRKRKKKAKW
jgi:hypothetical protein